jgi:hypothetical protein
MMDRVFPTAEYGQLLTAHAARHATVALPLDSQRMARRIVRSVLHGFIGWALVRNGDLSAAIREFDTALTIYSDNLPLTQLKLDTLLQQLKSGGNQTRGSGKDVLCGRQHESGASEDAPNQNHPHTEKNE